MKTNNKVKKNIILIDAQEAGAYGEPHLGLLAIGSLLKKKGYDVIILRILGDNIERISKFINKDTLAVGFSIRTIQIPTSLKVSKYIKEKFPNVKIVWGGVHVNLFPKQVLENENINIVVFGDGEYTMLEIAKNLERKKSLKGVRGCGYKENGEKILNPPRKPTDISKLPLNDYSLVYDIEEYREETNKLKSHAQGTYFTIQSAVGCPFNCSFCYNTIQKLRRSKRRVKDMLDEIEVLQKKYKPSYFLFNDELFLSDKERVQEFIREKKKRNLKFRWRAAGHIIFLKDEKFYSDKFLKELKNEGLIETSSGAESGSVEQLKRYRKNITPQEVIKVAERMERLKIHVLYSFMIGAPYETYDEMIDTIKLCYKIYVASPNYSFLQYPQIFRPYPGCDLYKEAVKLGYKDKEKLEEWTHVSKFTGYSSYYDLPYLRPLLPKIFNILYHFKFLKFFFTQKYLFPILRKKITYRILTNSYVVNHLGYTIKAILENRLFDKLISQKLFGRSLINLR